jgi:predicted AlkP superfamily pyrophosphatase or phosphodiesterase
MKRLILSVLLLLSCLIRPESLESAERPKLIIFISIDQMKAEYLDWYRAEFTGGLKRLCSEGTVFRNANLNYAPSETGPGHASLGTGTYPATSGIVSNEWIDPSTYDELYCVADSTARMVNGEGGGVSPRKLLVTGLGDWLKKASPASRVYAASIKDRAAILMSGKRPDGAFWYSSKSGHMVTSSYYTNELPVWAQAFNAGSWPSRNLPDTWTKLRPDSVYAKYGPDDVEGERLWENSRTFPHPIAPERKNQLLASTPYGDLMTLDFARTIVQAEKLGQRGVTDLLFISLSCTDYIGHAYGGRSHELIDHLLRLDRALGAFITDMELAVGGGNILIALSADHAAMPLPEYRTAIDRKTARRIMVQDAIYPRIAELEKEIQKELNSTEPIIKSRAFLNYEAATRAGLDSTALEQKIKQGILKIDGIADIVFRREILAGNGSGNRFLGYYQRGYYAPRGPDFILRPCEYCLFTTSTTGTSHGTPYRYDTNVPVVFWGTGVTARQVSRVVNTVDLAPTVAKVLGIATPPTVDGKVLKEIAR